MTRKRLTLAFLVCVLVLWIVLQTFHSLDEEDRFLRQMVTVTDVMLTGDAHDKSADEELAGQIEELVEPTLRHISACLKTPDGSRAPLEVEVMLGAAPHPDEGDAQSPAAPALPTPTKADAHDTPATPSPDASTTLIFRAEGGIDADVNACLHEALDSLEWSSLETRQPFVVMIAPLADTVGE